MSHVARFNCRSRRSFIAAFGGFLHAMTATADTWDSYAHLLARLSPRISHILFADPAGLLWWSSDPENASRVQYAVSLLLTPPGARQKEIDGVRETEDSAESRYGFRIRGALGELLGLVVVALPLPEARLDLAAVHSMIKPALDCLQRELTARAAATGETAGGWQSLAQIPVSANEQLAGAVAAILLPNRNVTICRKRPGAADGVESRMLAQMHRHLLTRAQLHGRTLVAKRTPYHVISTPIRDAMRRVVGVLAVLRADTERDFHRRDVEALELLASKAAQIIGLSFDSLTGLTSSGAFRAEAAARSAAAQSNQGLLYVDIDQLNVVNENHGMPVGDEVIRGVAALLSRRARDSSLVARLGGDRFCLLMPGCGIEPAARIAEELRSAAIRLSGARGDKPLAVSLSIGVARLGDGGLRLEHAIAAAELACRTAKARGGNRVEVFYGNERQPEVEPSALFASHSFELLAQPILPLRAAPAEPRFEMLLRVRAPDGTRLGVQRMQSAAASPQLAREIDRWVIEHAIERLGECRSVLRDHPATFSVNLSAASLCDAQFWAMLHSLVRDAGIEPGTLSFEFPEAAARAHAVIIAPRLHSLREQGIGFALDHFGCGIGSLSHLNSLPVSSVKIDGSFSRDLLDNPTSQSMVAAIAQLANTFGLETVACHVETDAIRARAAQLGVDYGQGFFIGRPVPLDDAINDLPWYTGFATSTGLFDPAIAAAAALGS
jgi:diguanylate cyclase (GGDEF)-like protein